MNQKIITEHFKKNDPVIYTLIEKIGFPEVKKSADYFHNLCRSICGQQLSTKVSLVIFNRFKTLFPEQLVTPGEVLKLKDEDMRLIGFSFSKISYLKDLSQKIVERVIDFSKIDQLSNDQVIYYLTQVKGIGVWTSEMFLIFTLGREDVFSPGDLGLKRAIQRLYGFNHLPAIKQMEKITAVWRPYRTYASKLLWKSLNNNPL